MSRSGTATKSFRVALAGNPNCGKTSLFNALTGLKYKVANYPGVTVEQKSGRLPLGDDVEVELTDLPGIYSLSGFSLDEKIATQFIDGSLEQRGRPDALIVVVDSTNLERNLYLLTQLIDRELPIVVALTMTDLAEKRGVAVYGELLARSLDLPVVKVLSNIGHGIDELKKELRAVLLSNTPSKQALAWLPKESAYAEAAADLAAENPLIFGVELLSETLPPPDDDTAEELRYLREELQGVGIDSYSFEAAKRYLWINSVVRRCSAQKESGASGLSEKFDHLITHRIWGVAFFLLVMATVFQSIFIGAEAPMGWIENALSSFAQLVGEYLPEGQLKSLVQNGIIAGVGSVLVFVPQIAILFLFLGILEDSGYLARAAFIMDRVMRPVGLQGRSFIPLLSSFACAIPGILSARTIPAWSDRMATILIAPLMSCSARLPVYTVLIAAFIPDPMVWGVLSLKGLVLFGMYALGVFGAAVVAWVLKLSVLRGKPALFVMEMPAFRIPSGKIVLREMWDRVLGFLKNATTMILACSVILWFLASYPQNEQSTDLRHSYAGQIGTFMEPVIKPLGYNWEIGVGILTSFAAREVFISALATVYNLQESDDATSSLVTVLREKSLRGEFSLATALSLMVFYVFACQCVSTLAVTRRETGGWKWPAFMFVYMTALAYGAAFITYQLAERWS